MSVISDVREYNELRKQKSLIEKRMKELGDSIKKYSMEHGVKDQNGSHYVQESNFVYGSVSRKTIKLNQEKAKNHFNSIGLLQDVIETKYEVSEDKINELLTAGTITEDDIEAIMDVKTSYSLAVTEQEEEVDKEMPTIEAQIKEYKKKKKLIKKVK